MSETINPLDDFLEKKGEQINNETTEKVEIPDNCWLDVTEDIVEPKWTLRFKGVGFAPLGDIQVLRGMEGNGKSFLFTILISAILKGEYGGLTCDIPNAKVLYIDTEQHKSNTLRLQRRVHHICGWKGKEANERFKVMILRDVEELKDRQNYLKQAIEDYKPTAVFLDGVADMVSDINNYKECMDYVRWMMATASKKSFSFWSILHINYGSQKMRGHLGTEIAHKTSDVLSCQKHKEGINVSFEVEQVKARNKDIENFSFVINDDETRLGIPVLIGTVDYDADTPTNRGERDILMAEIFEKDKTLSKRAIIDAIMRKRFIAGSDQEKTHAKLWFEQACDWGIIEYSDHKRQYYYVGLNAKPFGSPDATQTEIPY